MQADDPVTKNQLLFFAQLGKQAVVRVQVVAAFPLLLEQMAFHLHVTKKTVPPSSVHSDPEARTGPTPVPLPLFPHTHIVGEGHAPPFPAPTRHASMLAKPGRRQATGLGRVGSIPSIPRHFKNGALLLPSSLHQTGQDTLQKRRSQVYITPSMNYPSSPPSLTLEATNHLPRYAETTHLPACPA